MGMAERKEHVTRGHFALLLLIPFPVEGFAALVCLGLY